MRAITFSLVFCAVLILHSACVREKNLDKEIPAHLLDKFPTKSSAFPVSENDYVTEKK